MSRKSLKIKNNVGAQRDIPKIKIKKKIMRKNLTALKDLSFDILSANNKSYFTNC